MSAATSTPVVKNSAEAREFLDAIEHMIDNCEDEGLNNLYDLGNKFEAFEDVFKREKERANAAESTNQTLRMENQRLQQIETQHQALLLANGADKSAVTVLEAQKADLQNFQRQVVDQVTTAVQSLGAAVTHENLDWYIPGAAIEINNLRQKVVDLEAQLAAAAIAAATSAVTAPQPVTSSSQPAATSSVIEQSDLAEFKAELEKAKSENANLREEIVQLKKKSAELPSRAEGNLHRQVHDLTKKLEAKEVKYQQLQNHSDELFFVIQPIKTDLINSTNETLRLRKEMEVLKKEKEMAKAENFNLLKKFSEQQVVPGSGLGLVASLLPKSEGFLGNVWEFVTFWPVMALVLFVGGWLELFRRDIIEY